ncbi:transcription elongation factor GreB [Kineobactrum salinum]|uniref:Transcription elongation factor GreB n=1 Tax=Kineobactrum salinum TaxID=2708301 RepID=A0A6C0U534_9GAMM|nr:transcription elongation factor GreB [Kineobactrum salinum]QIB66963.1 transcription elongation factor GreB [Kineobactrum salinum]
MSRYRPPRRRGSTYITPEGEQALRRELHQLWKVERPVVTDAVHEAAKNGDRSENGDYIYGKRRLREIDSRVRFLSKRLEELTVVDRAPADTGKVFFGAWVTLEDEAGNERRWRIVGPDEFELAAGKLSMDSPMARAILGKRLDDEVVVHSPQGSRPGASRPLRIQKRRSITTEAVRGLQPHTLAEYLAAGAKS